MKINEYVIDTEESMVTGLQEYKGLSEADPASEFSKETRKKKPKHALQKQERKVSVKKKKKGTFTPAGTKIHDPKGYKRKGKDPEVDEGKHGRYPRKKNRIRKRAQKQQDHPELSHEKNHHTYSGSKMQSSDCAYKRKPKPRVNDVEENASKPKSGNPKVEKPRNPVAKNMTRKGGKHVDKKKDYRRKPKHPQKDPELGNLRNQIRSASIYD